MATKEIPEGESIIEALAQKSGLTPKQVVEKMIEKAAKKYGVNMPSENTDLSQIKGISDNKVLMSLLGGGEGGFFESLMKYKVAMREIDKDNGGADKRIADLEAKLDKVLAELKQEKEKDALMSRIDRLELLIAEGGSSKKDAVSEELKEIRNKLDQEKEKRFEGLLAEKSKAIDDFKRDYDEKYSTLEERYNDLIDQQREPKESEDLASAIVKFFTQMNQVDSAIRDRGKALGLTETEIETEIDKKRPFKENVIRQALTGGLKLLDKAIDKGVFGGEDDEGDGEPQIKTTKKKTKTKKKEEAIEPEPGQVEPPDKGAQTHADEIRNLERQLEEGGGDDRGSGEGQAGNP